MNHDLKKMIVDAEARYLNESELERIRRYAKGMTSRLETMRRLQHNEEVIVVEACEKLAATHPTYFRTIPDAKKKLARDMKLTLRYVAQAHVRDDMDFFRKNYAAWIGTLLKSICPRDVLVPGQEGLRDAMEAHLDAADFRELRPYIEAFVEELRA